MGGKASKAGRREEEGSGTIWCLCVESMMHLDGYFMTYMRN